MRPQSRRVTPSSRSRPACPARAFAAAGLPWLGLTACSDGGPPVQLSPPPGPATIGSTADGTGRIDPRPDPTQSAPSLSRAYLDCQRAAQFAGSDFIQLCSKPQSPGRMQGRSRNRLLRTHEAMRDSALTQFRSPAATSERSLTRGLGLLVCWVGWRSTTSSRASKAGRSSSALRQTAARPRPGQRWSGQSG